MEQVTNNLYMYICWWKFHNPCYYFPRKRIRWNYEMRHCRVQDFVVIQQRRTNWAFLPTNLNISLNLSTSFSERAKDLFPVPGTVPKTENLNREKRHTTIVTSSIYKNHLQEEELPKHHRQYLNLLLLILSCVKFK